MGFRRTKLDKISVYRQLTMQVVYIEHKLETLKYVNVY